MALVSSQDNQTDGLVRVARGTRTGTRTAANFTITLGFDPKYVKVINLTDRIQAELFVNSALGTSNAEELLRVADGTTTYASAGIAVSNNTFTVTVATAGLETDDDDVYWEAWG